MRSVPPLLPAFAACSFVAALRAAPELDYNREWHHVGRDRAADQSEKIIPGCLAGRDDEAVPHHGRFAAWDAIASPG